jgi:hypothetical protein
LRFPLQAQYNVTAADGSGCIIITNMVSEKALSPILWKRIWRITRLIIRNCFWMAASLLILARSSSVVSDPAQLVHTFTRGSEFDFVVWTLNAISVKVSQGVLGAQNYLDAAAQHNLVVDYLDLVSQSAQLNYQVNLIYADPQVKDPKQASLDKRQQLADVNTRLNQLAPLAESILQSQVAQVAAAAGLSLGGQPVPPVLYHVTDLPLALIISPLQDIKEDQDISLLPGMTAEDMTRLEKQVEQKLNVSALVVGIGGVGIYPTMVERSSDLNWLADTIAHEWTHNFLTLRPLGLSYAASPQLRTINETTASLVGRELGLEVLKRYYPEKVPPPPAAKTTPEPTAPAGPPPFNFNLAMHDTRVTVDRLLKEGRLKDAADYMEERRQLFWDAGYLIRRLNQAYFAFYGAYNDVSTGGSATGQAGQDPVGPAVAALRQKSGSLAAFLNRISWMTSFDQLQAAVK